MSLDAVHSLLAWFQQKGGYVHPSAEVRDGMSSSLLSDPARRLTHTEKDSGIGLYASSPIEADAVLISCPCDLAISSVVAKRALEEIHPEQSFEDWSARMLIAAYVGLHWVYADKKETQYVLHAHRFRRKGKHSFCCLCVADSSDALAHGPYIDSLPPPPITPLYYTEKELALLTGTNLLPGSQERKRQWQEESKRVQELDKGLTW